MLRPRLLALGFCLSACIGSAASAQETRDPDRPTVGLVLSGGAAKGLAHIGAIRVLEDAGIPVDVVSGTSMGAIIGGLYAAGYTPGQMGEIVASGDWANLFTDAVDRRDTGVLGRVGEGSAILSLPVENGAVSLPSGLVAGQEVLAFLNAVFWPVHEVRDFRTLPRSFAALAVDAETGEPVRFTSGSLPKAIRASMSLPSLFEPIEIDGRRFLDGGFARNLPAEDAVALGADVLVCVDVSASDEAASLTRSFVDVLVDAAFFAAERGRSAQRDRCDILIDPDVNGLSLFDFDRADAWIQRGIAAAKGQRAALDALAAHLGHPPRNAVSSPPDQPEPVRIARVEVEGVGPTPERVLRSVLSAQLDIASGNVGPDAIGRVLSKIHASGAFRLVSYRLDSLDEDSAVLVVEADPTTTDRLGFGFRYDTQYNAALLFELELRNRLLFGSTAQFDVRLGEFILIGGRYLAALGLETPWSVALTGGYIRAPLQVFLDADRAQASGYFRLASLEAYTGPILFDALATGIGVRLVWNESAPEVAAATIQAVGARYVSFAAIAVLDTRDRPDFAREGVDLFLAADVSPGLGRTFQRIVADVEGATRLSPLTSVGVAAFFSRAWGLADPFETSPDQFVHLGGPVAHDLFFRQFVPLFGAEPQEFIGPAALVARAHVHLESQRGLFLRAALDTGYARPELTADTDAFRSGYGVSVGFNTLGGPLEVMLHDALVLDTPNLLIRFGHRF